MRDHPIPTPEFLALQRAIAGRYSLERELGRGGMGIVFLARDVALDRLVAIKLLPPELATAERRRHFLNEARLAAGLSHPHVVPIHSVEECDELAFYVMGYVDGETLGERIRREGRIPPGEAARIMQEVAWALGHAHARGIVHRDIKPDNILLERGTGRALVVDFGIGTAVHSVVTSGAQVAGTPRFMSPEQLLGEPADGRADLYSLGVTLHLALTGQYPPHGEAASARLPVPVRDGDALAVALRRSVERCLAPEPALRPADADALAAQLAALRSRRGELSPPLRAWVREVDRAGSEMGFGVAGALVALVLALFFRDSMFMAPIYLLLATLMLGLAGARYGQLVMHARTMLGNGLGFDAAARALEQAQAEDTHDIEDRSPRRLGAGARATALLGVIKSGALIWLAGLSLPIWASILAIAGSVVVPAAFVRRFWDDLFPHPSLLPRLMRGGVGRFTFSAARTGLRGLPETAPVAEPTMVAVARSAEDLFRGLSPPARERLGDISQVIGRLRGEGLRRRDAGDDLGMAQVIAALDGLRLELLRLHAGGGTEGELTRAIEQAQEIGREVDRLVPAREEVERIVARTPS